MDPQKFSSIAHQRHSHANPIGAAKLQRALELAELRPGDRVLDVGCGKAELLIGLVERHGVHGVGVDLSALSLLQARQAAAARLKPGRIELIEARADEAGLPPGSFDLACCIGSTHAYGGLRPALQALRTLVRPGGRVLVGDGYWKREPDPEYLAALQSTADEAMPHARNVAAHVEAGLVPLYSCVASEDEWDAYEGLYLYNVERYAAETPEDPDVPAMLARIRGWRDTYLRWGRDTLGFGLYLSRA